MIARLAHVGLLALTVPWLAGCPPLGFDCGCTPPPTIHPQGERTSEDGDTLHVAGEVVELRLPDGTIRRYRIRSTGAGYGNITRCGDKSPAHDLRKVDLDKTRPAVEITIATRAPWSIGSQRQSVAIDSAGHIVTIPTDTSNDRQTLTMRVDPTNYPDGAFQVFVDYDLVAPDGRVVADAFTLELTRQHVCDDAATTSGGPVCGDRGLVNRPVELDCI